MANMQNGCPTRRTGETLFVILLLAGLATLIGAMLATQARHRSRLRGAEPLVLRVPAPPNLRQLAIVTAWFLGPTLVGISGLVAALRAGAPLAPSLALGIVTISAIAIALAVRAERRFSIGEVTMDENSLRIVVEGERREIEIDPRRPFAVERFWCPRAHSTGAMIARVDQGERSLYLWYPPRLSELNPSAITGQPIGEVRGLYLGGDGAEVIRRLRERVATSTG
ncbi:MAG: hypothetical protein EXR73_14355 [Myxococcales bacterium]|nr:hypothetical protein [Myxococcales bacterium]